jgi:hypothetical protein
MQLHNNFYNLHNNPTATADLLNSPRKVFSGDSTTKLLYESLVSTQFPRFVSRDPDKQLKKLMGCQLITNLIYGEPYSIRFIIMSESIYLGSIHKHIHGMIDYESLQILHQIDNKILEQALIYRSTNKNLIINDSWILPRLISDENYRYSETIYLYQIGEDVSEWTLSEFIQCLPCEPFSKNSMSLHNELNSPNFKFFKELINVIPIWDNFLVARYIFYSYYSNFFQTRRKICNKTYYKVSIFSTEFSALAPVPEAITYMEPNKAVITLITRGIPLYPSFAIDENSDEELVHAKHELSPIEAKTVCLNVDLISGQTTIRYCTTISDQDLRLLGKCLVEIKIPVVRKNRIKIVTGQSNIFFYNPKFLWDYDFNLIESPCPLLNTFKNLIDWKNRKITSRSHRPDPIIRTNKWNSLFLINKNISLYEGILFEVVGRNHSKYKLSK